LRSVTPIHPSADVVPLGRFDLHDIESIRLLLRGSSVVDWVSLHFENAEEIDAFIRVCCLDPEDRRDRARLLDLKRRAVKYLEEHLRYRLPDVIKDAEDVRHLFQWASQTKGRRMHRFYACVTLKVMHIINHSDAYELLSMLQVSQAELAVLLHAKIERMVRGLLEREFPIVEFSGNLKTPSSIYSKLLAKKDTQSAQIYDKLRFRFVVERLEDLPPLLIALTRELVPFNYVVPGQTHNSLVDLYRMLVRAGNVNAIRAEQAGLSWNEPPLTDLTHERRNEFSGPDYQVVNFVGDLPLRIDHVLSVPDQMLRELGPVVFGAVEFQLVDRVTADQNETGENRHTLYKARQRAVVRQRLERGKRLNKPREVEEEEAPKRREKSAEHRRRGEA
jgi:uncharacterized protein (TIGR04552 family)